MGKLIRLELFNFKSYKGHHTLLFGDSYFTSIIGPNGSGKSNSMDAISFVLGIKSSHLRSAHLKDLVYRGRVLKTSKINDDGSAAEPTTNGHTNGHVNGDDNDKPNRSDPKTAWVMAVYEDDAGDEQRWKRSITNQGSSEYRINDRVVTAQQYNEALEAENILIKARNFLVFQGDVEAIAAQSPQDLTRLIEQISGSLEYKPEYEKLQSEADQAAENSNFQLQRRRGINSEIKQYQEQKREAENFEKKTEERDAAIVTHILWKLYHFQQVMDDSSAKIQDHQENLKEFRRNVESFERKLEAARKEQADAAKEVHRVERQIKRQEKEIEEKENSLVPIEEKVQQTSSQAETIRTRIEGVRKERDEQRKLIAKIEKDLATVQKAQKQFEDQWKETMKKQGKELSDADRKEYNTLRAQALNKSSENQAKLENLNRQLKTDEVTVNSLKGKVDGYQAAVEKLETELAAIQERKRTTEATVKQLSSEMDAKKKEFNQIQSERVRTNQRRTELDEKLQDVLRKLLEADDGRRQNDKEARIKEMVTSLKRIYPGVKGRVGELCKPKQKKFDEAVITALGRDFDSIIVDSEKTGVECVQYLKDQRFPPMTFIPLDNIKVNAVNTAVKGISGARLTIDAIDFDSSLERAMSYACGGSIVCDTLDIAKQVCYDRRIQVKAVTLEGFVIHKAGLMTGGRVQENKGNKRRFEEHDVQNLQKMADKFRDEIEKIPRADRRGVAEESLQNELAGLDQRLAFANSELAAFNQNLTSKKKELEHVKRQLKEWQPKFKDEDSNLQKTRASVEKFKSAIAEVEDKIFADFCKRLGYSDIRAYEAQQGSLEQEADEKRTQFDLQRSRLESNKSWETSRYKDTENRLHNLEVRLKQLSEDIKSYRAEKKAIEEAMSNDQDNLEALQEQLDEYKAELTKRTEKVNAAKAEVQKRSKDIESRQKAISALETEVQKNSAGKFALLRRCRLEQINVPLISGSLDNLPNEDNLLHQDPDAMDVDDGDDAEMMDNAMDDHGIEVDFDQLDDDLKNPDDEGIEEKLQEKISSLTAELEKLNPNMRAIERLEVVEARLKATERDYNESKAAFEAAKDAFDEIKTKRFELFNKAFVHIREQIEHVYKDLTRSDQYPLGGQAYLDIEEDTDRPYLSGIKYHAMPPLKRFRDMEHLSGGEKTMAALALLFAIHSYQPSPFFVLDEVDAALDNANVDKIKNYIREHAGPGMQFIVISLKTGLFQDSESLVGVYRDQEVNSSRTLTLDLRKYV
ncbi:Structural maintenance of chromosomes protein 1 [Daldinia childiae]|uniref:Structural maintenance of chromosomes protein 1 n=1 Tax=Daldinia childiae TaxID=326645 RepID=UPI00144615B3|nr:Structural maintenance of chromosomes protein 1 [Daldinia childiae]KAF3062027.1 Structural maintenance of chromosomes protein 1 [Daldinia childiae]